MSARFAGQVAAVTGASSGIGAAIARALADEGAAVVGYARRFAGGKAVAPAPGRVQELGLDVTDEAAVEARFAELGAVDLLVHCAGSGCFAPVASTQAADLRAQLEVHVVGTFLCSRAAMRRMQAGARIVVLGSVATQSAFPDCGAYTAAKMGQLGIARVLREELRPRGIGVTHVTAGAVDTPIWSERPGFDRSQMMRPDDLAAAVVDAVARPGLVVEDLVVVPPAGRL